MRVTVPKDTSALMDRDRRHPDGRVFVGIPPACGIHVASWLLRFVRTHHDLVILWPSGRWLHDHHEASRTSPYHVEPPRPMVCRSIGLAPHGLALLRARAELDGSTSAEVLRRLLVQHFGRLPSDPVLVTGGRHVRTPGQANDCESCGMIAMSWSQACAAPRIGPQRVAEGVDRNLVRSVSDDRDTDVAPSRRYGR